MVKKARKEDTVQTDTTETSPTESLEQKPVKSSYLYNGGIITTITVDDKEYTLYPGKDVLLPRCKTVESLLKQNILSARNMDAGKA